MNYPLAFGLAGLIPVIVVLYLLKVRRRQQSVSSLIFWRRVVEEHRRRALFHRLRNFWSLLLNLCILLCLMLAAAQIDWGGIRGESGSTLIILDNRARMQAKDQAGKTRLDLAKTVVQPLLRQAGARYSVGLLAVENEPRSLVAFSDDRQQLLEALQQLKPTDTGGDLSTAIRLGEELLATRTGARRLILISDEPSDLRRDGIEARQITLTTGPLDNLAIVGFEARPLVNSRQSADIFVRVANYAADRRAVNLELSVDRQLFDLKKLELNPGEDRIATFSGVPVEKKYANSTGDIVARIAAEDALAVDNEAYAVLPDQRPARLLLVTEGNWFLENLARANEEVQSQIVTPENYQPDLGKSFDVVVFDRKIPAGVTLSSPGNLMFCGAIPWKDAATIDRPTVVDLDTSSPLLRFVDLASATILSASRLPESVPGWNARPVAQGPDGPLILTLQNSAQRRVIVGFDPVNSDLPLRVAFPLLLQNSINWLSNRSEEVRTQFRTGEEIRLGANQQLAESGLEGRILTVGGSFRAMQQGIYRIGNDPERPFVAVNLLDRHQSDLRNIRSRPVGTPAPKLGLTSWFAWPPWVYFAILALLLSALEWWLYHQRRTE